MTETPIACTLSPDGLQARLALIETLAADGMIDRTPTAAGLRVRLRDTPEIEQRTRELVAAESRCCAFLTFDVARHDGHLVLSISGPEDARPVIDMFFEPGSSATDVRVQSAPSQTDSSSSAPGTT